MARDLNKPIIAAMNAVGVHVFWQGVVLQHINRAMNTNRYFTTEVLQEPVVIANSFGHAVSVQLTIARTFPDDRMTDKATLTYTFNPKDTVAHRVKVEAASRAKPIA